MAASQSSDDEPPTSPPAAARRKAVRADVVVASDYQDDDDGEGDDSPLSELADADFDSGDGGAGGASDSEDNDSDGSDDVYHNAPPPAKKRRLLEGNNNRNAPTRRGRPPGGRGRGGGGGGGGRAGTRARARARARARTRAAAARARAADDDARNRSLPGRSFTPDPRLRAVDISVVVVNDAAADPKLFRVVPRSNRVQSVWAENVDDDDDVSYVVGFEDGRVEEVAFDDLHSLANGSKAFELFHRDLEPEELASKDYQDRFPRKRGRPKMQHNYSSVVSSDEESSQDGGPPKRQRFDSDDARLRRSTRHTSRISAEDHVMLDSDDEDMELGRRGTRNQQTLTATRNGKLRITRQMDDPARRVRYNEPDEVVDGSDGDYQPVRSDVLPKQKSKKMRGRRLNHYGPTRSRSSSIEFESRRSGRANKNTKYMRDSMLDDDLYVEDDKTSALTRVVNIKEVFQTLPADSEFRLFHMTICDSCNMGPNKGQFVHCQGCSLTYHRICLGVRSAREHLVTKVYEDEFVLQCRYCIGTYKKKDISAPAHDVCQDCKVKGPSCAPFSERKSAKQEEKLRLENDGVDPITPVREDLINNAQGVLFRCVACRRAYHFQHLADLENEAETEFADTLRLAKLNEYSANWRCKDCLDMAHERGKIQGLVAWRPSHPDSYQPHQTCLELVEEGKEYLVKWADKSYNHCTWMPGAWIWGVTAATMRNAFARRNESKNLYPRMTSKEAIPEEYLMADIILQVEYARGSRASSKATDFARIQDVKRAHIKFEGLGYDEAVWDTPPQPGDGEQWESFKEAYYEFLNGKYFASEPLHKIRERIKHFRAERKFEESIALKRQPEGLERGKLMEYQLRGVNWLLYNFYLERSAVLADEMGLGKTVQVIAFIATVVQKQPKAWPFLIVVPNSTCPNWRREVKQWAPDLRVVAYHGGREPQDLAYNHELFPDNSGHMKAHIVVMSYDSAQDPRTRQLFKSVPWVGLIVDEGQRLKNDQNLLYTALSDMKIPFRLLLTGTPLQNNKRELFNLLQFIDKDKNAAELDEKYKEITKDAIKELHDMIRPVFLRRTKLEVLKFLPNMGQIIIPVTMTIVQEKLCKSIILKKPDLIQALLYNKKLKVAERGSLNNILMQLRKCLCHPFIYSDAIEEAVDDPEAQLRNLISASGKLMLLEIMLAKLKEGGHRVLIFSQFLGELDIIEDFLIGLHYKYGRLDGSIPALEKQKRIDAFNAPNSEYFAFLLSTRAGGVGINLATADTVVIMDPDFNPHQDLQALSRAHRIGQTKPVLCFQLMTKATVEEKIMQIGRKKMALDHVLIESMDDKNEDAGNDLESILRHGAEALFGDNKKDDKIHYDSASVDKLLDRTSLAAKIEDEKKTSEPRFSFAHVWANNDLGGDLEDSEDAAAAANPSVWENILQEREAEAQRLAMMNQEVLGRGGRRRQRIVTYRTPGANDLEDPAGDSMGAPPRSESDVDDDFGGESSDSDGDSDEYNEGAVPEVMVQENGTTLAVKTNNNGRGRSKSGGASESHEDEAGRKGPRETNGDRYDGDYGDDARKREAAERKAKRELKAAFEATRAGPGRPGMYGGPGGPGSGPATAAGWWAGNGAAAGGPLGRGIADVAMPVGVHRPGGGEQLVSGRELPSLRDPGTRPVERTHGGGAADTRFLFVHGLGAPGSAGTGPGTATGRGGGPISHLPYPAANAVQGHAGGRGNAGSGGRGNAAVAVNGSSKPPRRPLPPAGALYSTSPIPNPLLGAATAAMQNHLVYNHQTTAMPKHQTTTIPNLLTMRPSGVPQPNDKGYRPAAPPLNLPPPSSSSLSSSHASAPCARCGSNHPPKAGCAVFTSEIQVRLAIDDLRSSGASREAVQPAMTALQTRLRQFIAEKEQRRA